MLTPPCGCRDRGSTGTESAGSAHVREPRTAVHRASATFRQLFKVASVEPRAAPNSGAGLVCGEHVLPIFSWEQWVCSSGIPSILMLPGSRVQLQCTGHRHGPTVTQSSSEETEACPGPRKPCEGLRASLREGERGQERLLAAASTQAPVHGPVHGSRWLVTTGPQLNLEVAPESGGSPWIVQSGGVLRATSQRGACSDRLFSHLLIEQMDVTDLGREHLFISEVPLSLIRTDSTVRPHLPPQYTSSFFTWSPFPLSPPLSSIRHNQQENTAGSFQPDITVLLLLPLPRASGHVSQAWSLKILTTGVKTPELSPSRLASSDIPVRAGDVS